MRLTCPNCGAQYRVPAEAIPQTGRDVQCSNCGDTWFQAPAAHPDAPAAEASAPGAPATPPPADAGPAQEAAEPQPARPEQREIDPAVTSVLREEAERERRARAAAQEGLTTQPDLGLDAGPDPARRAEKMSKAPMRGAEAVSTPEASGIDPAPRRGLFPDIEEINSSLAPGSGQAAIGPAPASHPGALRRGAGFRRGFLLAVLVMVLALLIYIFAPQLAEAVPALQAPLAGYVDWVDGLRGWLDGVASAAVADTSGT